MELTEYLRALRRRWVIVLAAAVLAGVAAFVTTPPPDTVPEQRSYTATHTLFDDPTVEGQRDVGLDTMAFLAETGEIPQRVAERVAWDATPQELADQVTITTDQAIGTMQFTVEEADDGDRAVLIADAFAEETLAFFQSRQSELAADRETRLLEQQQELETQMREIETELADVAEGSADYELLQSEQAALGRRYSAVTEQLQEASADETGGLGIITIESAAPVPVTTGGFTAPTNREARTGLGAALGALLGAVLAIGVDRLDTRLQDRRSAESAFRLPVLAEVPRVRKGATEGKVLTVEQPASFAAESYRILRLSLQMSTRWSRTGASGGEAVETNGAGHANRVGHGDRDEAVQVVLVTSAGPAEGKTSTAANVAASYAELGKQVLLIDADFRNPQQHRYYSVPRSPGVTEYLTRGQRRPPLAGLAQPTEVPGVQIVPNGTLVDNPGELIGPEQDLVSAARELADVVIIDAGPVLAVNDPAALMPQVDAVVVTARSGQTRVDSAARAVELLTRMDAPVVGLALVGVPRHSSGQPYYAQLRSVPGPNRRRGAATPRWQRDAQPSAGSDDHARRGAPSTPSHAASQEAPRGAGASEPGHEESRTPWSRDRG